MKRYSILFVVCAVLIVFFGFMMSCATAPVKPQNSAEALILAEAALTEANLSHGTITEQAVFYQDAGVLENADESVKTLMGVDALLAVAEQSGEVFEEAKADVLAARTEGRALTLADVEPYVQKRHEAEARSRQQVSLLAPETPEAIMTALGDARTELDEAASILNLAHTTLDISSIEGIQSMSIPAIRRVIRQAAVAMVRHSQGTQ